MGSKIGWILAGVVVLVVAIIVIIAVAGTFAPDPEDPTAATTAPGVLDLHEVDADVTMVLPARPTGSGNAAVDYAAAGSEAVENELSIKDYYKNAIKNAKSVSPDAEAKMESIRKLVSAGAGKKNFEFVLNVTGNKFRAVPPRDFREKCVDPLEKASDMMRLLAEHHRVMGKSDQALAVQRDRFTMGWHMMNERVRVPVVMVGVYIQQSAIKGMIKILSASEKADDKTQIANLRSYESQLDKIVRIFNKKEKIIAVISPHAGDVFNIIENDKDRAWRIEGLLILGAFKYGEAHHKGNLKKVEDLLEKFSDSDDPYEKAAAQRSIDFNDDDARTNWNFEL